MDRTVYINIAGKEYPMRFSLGASKKIAEKFGSLKKMQDNLTGDASGEGTEAKSLEVIAYMLAVLIKQGCAYKNLFEADQPIPPNAPVKDGKYVGLEQEEIEVALDMADMEAASKKIFEAIGAGNAREVNAKGKPENKRKNAGTT